MDPYVPKHCPVKEACQFSSPLISVQKFKEQCWQLIGKELNVTTSSSKVNHVTDVDASAEGGAEKEKEGTAATTDELGVGLDGVKETQEDIDALAKVLQTDEQTIQELKEVCSIDNLKCDYDKYDVYKLRAFEEFPSELDLETVKICKLGRTRQEELYYAQNFMEPIKEDVKEDDKTLPTDEVILCVSMYHPHRRRPQQVFYVHANQKLSELRDAILCPSDKIILGEFSNNPDMTGVKSAKELTGSSFFMIEQIFYNDMRNPLNRDYSKTIMDWAKEGGRHTIPGLGLFESASMENTYFRDLNLRLGYPYLFCHQGNCEHIVVFLDMRIINETDVRKVTSYPVTVMEGRKKRGKCSVCNIHMIKWKTKEDGLAFEDPSYFCEKCFRYLHYGEDGKKLYDFEAYPCVDMEY